MALIARSDIPSASPRHTAHIDLLTNRCEPCPRNRTKYAYYDGFNKVATSYQEHYGAVNTSTSLKVQYLYDTTTTGSIYSNQLRLQTEVHPNGRSIYYDYGASSSSTAAYSATSTIREIWDGSPSGTGLAVYDYNGAGSRLAIGTYPQPSFKLDHFEGTSGTYAGLDRFGRIIDHYWAGFGGTSDVDRIHYAYDYAGNRTYRQIDPAIYPTENMDQAYTYDALYRLLTSQVGTLSSTTISGTPTIQEAWTLDGLGNWAGYVTQASGTANLNQTRTSSPANEISGISASVGATWATPAYDLAGNMTTIPIPTNLTSGYTGVYDGWNRLVSLASGSTAVATYSYDGLNRRIVKAIYVSGTLDHKEHAYHNEDWQLLEVRKEVSGSINGNPLEQYVWHSFYLDGPVLRDYDPATSGSPTRYYCTADANHNVTAATTSAGSPSERYYYSPYGNLTFLDGSFNPLATQQSQIGNAVTYTGRHCDAESGLYYFRHRYFHSAVGNFLSRDPLGYDDDFQGNLYEYLLDSPLAATDPFGLRPLEPGQRLQPRVPAPLRPQGLPPKQFKPGSMALALDPQPLDNPGGRQTCTGEPKWVPLKDDDGTFLGFIPECPIANCPFERPSCQPKKMPTGNKDRDGKSVWVTLCRCQNPFPRPRRRPVVPPPQVVCTQPDRN